MDEIQTQARLVDSAVSDFAARAISTTLPRAEIEEAMASGDYPARLMLDVSRVEGGTAVIPHARVAVEWDESALEELLRATSADEVTLRFDADALERALEECEVDAHGMRERAAVLAVAVAAVGAGAGGASAMTGGDVAGVSAAPVTFVSDVQSGGTGEPAAAPSFVSDVQSGGTGEPATAPSFVSDVASGGIGQPEGDALSRYATNVGSGDTTATPAAPSFVSDVASGGSGEPATVPAAGDSWTLSPAEDAGIAAGVALLISAAGFTLVRSRKRPVRPA